MAFRLSGIDPAPFEALFALTDEALQARGMRRCIADSDRGYPCRVGLEDAMPGDELLLLPWEHQPAASPYRASGPIFVRRGATRAVLPPGVVPASVTRRLMSLRAYDGGHWIREGVVCEGMDVAAGLERLFGNPAIAYVHLHNARWGCYACVAHRT